MQELTDTEVQVLDFERLWWKHAGSKDAAIRDLFAISPNRYYQVLNALIDRPEAYVYAPTVVKRLQRLRAERAARRAS